MSSALQNKLPQLERHTCCTRPPPPRWDRWVRMLEVRGGRIHVAVDFFFWFLTVRGFFCPFKQIRRRWPICASRIRGSLCLKMVHHFMGIESHVWICRTYRSGAPTWLLAQHKARRKKGADRRTETGIYETMFITSYRIRCDGKKRNTTLSAP